MRSRGGGLAEQAAEANTGGPAAAGVPEIWRVWGVDFDARIVQTVAACVFVLLLAYLFYKTRQW